jgi:hypothetical protein
LVVVDEGIDQGTEQILVAFGEEAGVDQVDGVFE